jgi:hypothetical protein
MDVSNQSSCNGHSPNLYKCIDTLKHGNLYQDYPSSSLKLLSRLCNAPVGNSNPPVKAKLPLQIVVVGAGLGGLASAIALARRGHGVTVLEQASVLAEVRNSYFIKPSSNIEAVLTIHAQRSALGSRYRQTRTASSIHGALASTLRAMSSSQKAWSFEGGKTASP